MSLRVIRSDDAKRLLGGCLFIAVYAACVVALVHHKLMPTAAGLIGAGVAITAYFFTRVHALVLFLAYFFTFPLIEPRPARFTFAGIFQISLYTATNLAAIQVLHRLKKTLQLLTIARDEALAATKAKSAFLATMSHEIRTPMNGVLGMTALLLETELSADQRDLAETGQRSAVALLAIIDDVLDFSKIEAGKCELATTAFDPRSLVEDAVDLLGERASQKGLELVSLVSPKIPSTISSDASRVRQVLLNLLSNAVKFTETGEVVLRVDVVESSSSQTWMRFQVSDTGIGISSEAQTKLFEPFSQVDTSTTRRYGGTGLGLAISKQIVEMLGGTIGVTSTPGEGTTFWFILPLLSPSPIESPAATGTTAPRPVRVLVVDDNAASREMFHQLLSEQSYRVDTVAGYREALNALENDGPYGIVLIDSTLPEMSGLELGKRIRCLPQCGRLPLILMVPVCEGNRGVASRDDVFAGYLTKPVRRMHLDRCLQRASGVQSGAPDSPAIENAPARHTGKRVLLAEDNLVNQKVAVRVLQKQAVEVDVVANGAAAVEAASRSGYDLILMDCEMPEMDGFAATREIRRREGSHRHTPILAMTASAMHGDRERCLEAGMDDYLTKPIDLQALSRALDQWTAARGASRLAIP